MDNKENYARLTHAIIEAIKKACADYLLEIHGSKTMDHDDAVTITHSIASGAACVLSEFAKVVKEENRTAFMEENIRLFSMTLAANSLLEDDILTLLKSFLNPNPDKPTKH